VKEGATTTGATERSATPALARGPYFKENAPLRTSLIEPGIEGTRLTVTGRVLTLSGKPVAQARLDFWQADNNGVYDNIGFKLRGHQFTDSEGRYLLETIVPGLYEPRTRHIHVRIRPPEEPELTTQLLFPDEPRNQTDPIFHPALVMNVRDTEAGKQATFDFVLNIE